MRKSMNFIGGPLDGHNTEVYCAYLDSEGNKIPVSKGDKIRRSGKGGLYYNRGSHYEWKRVNE